MVEARPSHFERVPNIKSVESKNGYGINMSRT